MFERCLVEYVSLPQAVEELARRQADRALRQRVREVIGEGMVLARAEQLVGGDQYRVRHSTSESRAQAAAELADVITDEQQLIPFTPGMVGVIGRQIATGRFEDIHFVRRCERVGLDHVCLEYWQDRFCTVNPAKVCMWRLRALEGFGRHGGPRLHRADVIKHPGFWTRQPLADVMTDWDESLVAFHQRIRRRLGWPNGAMDASDWLNRVGGEASRYYQYYFLLAVSEMILFESFVPTGFHGLDEFNHRVVNPALGWLAERGFPKPLIVLHPEDPHDQFAVEGRTLTENEVLNWYPADPFRDLTDQHGQPLNLFPRL